MNAEPDRKITNHFVRSAAKDEACLGEVAVTYVYILQSIADPRRHYTGMTTDLKDRLRRHNAGEVSHTFKHVPWRIRVAVSFDDASRAAAFEKYLKSHSGRVFASRHF